VDVLLNWLAHGVIVALAAAAVLRMMPPSRTRARHRFLWSACVLVLALPVVPYVVLLPISLPQPGAAAARPGHVVSVPTAWWTSTTLVGGAWAAWCAAHAVRLLAAVVALRRMKRRLPECPADVQDRLLHWSVVRATGRRTRLALSTQVRSAAVLGCGSPVIALAPALLDHLSDANLDRVVIHEWAHVQQRDDIAQVVQRILHAIAGWHPAVWWLERQLEQEREVACDQIAVAVTGSARAYATCLVTLAALPAHAGRSLPELTAVPPHGLRRRLLRILAAPPVAQARRSRTNALPASVALAVLALAAGSVPLVGPVATRSVVTAPPSGIREAGTIRSPYRLASPVVAQAPAVTPNRPRLRSEPRARAAKRGTEGPRDRVGISLEMIERPASLVAAMPLSSRERTLSDPTPVAIAVRGGGTSGSALAEGERLASARDPLARAGKASSPWAAAADAGLSVGRASQTAGVATAGFFRRFGQKIAGSF
jgi:beta-lactamase regulating signal transducer with metallopeptidase domain